MKNIIGIGTLMLAVIAVAIFGMWYQNEQAKQYQFQQQQNIESHNRVKPAADPVSQERDPFGSFASNEMTYEIVLKTQWSNTRHPGNFPDGAHFSAPVIWTGASNPVFSLGSKASAGMKEMAETGTTRQLSQELEKLQEEGRVNNFVVGTQLDAFDEGHYQVTLDKSNPVISLVSMLAPSPDWFVALEGINMIEDARWKNDITIQALTLDAGTEEGMDFSIKNPATSPAETIGVLKDIPSQSMQPFAVVEIKRIGYERK